MPFHNPALLLLWKVAAIEASHLDSEYIEPIHFILAALKTVDIDINEVYDSTFMPPEEVKNIDNEIPELTQNLKDLNSILTDTAIEPSTFGVYKIDNQVFKAELSGMFSSDKKMNNNL